MAIPLAENGTGQVVVVLAIIAATIILARISRTVWNKIIKKSEHLGSGDKTQFILIKHFTVAVVYIVGIGLAIYTVPQLRAVAVSMFAGAGILAVAIGFASQQAFSNIISGVFIVLFKPFRVGDRIKLKDVAGIIEDITLRHTVIRNWENKRVIVPNSVISNEQIENASIEDEQTCKWLEIGISYDSNADKALKIMREEAEKHPLCIDHRTEDEKKAGEPKVAAKVVGLGDSSVNLRAWVWAKTPGDAWLMGCDLIKSVKERFDREGIEVPFPYRTLVFKDEKKRVKRKSQTTRKRSVHKRARKSPKRKTVRKTSKRKARKPRKSKRR